MAAGKEGSRGEQVGVTAGNSWGSLHHVEAPSRQHILLSNSHEDTSSACPEQVLVEQLRHMCLEEKVGRDGAAGKGYNALTQSAKEWTLEPAKPCSGERLLLMFDRW